jgi:hypothetical protein
LDDLSVDVPKAPLQVGSVLGDLVAAGGADLKALAQHIRTADANPDEIQVRSVCGWSAVAAAFAEQRPSLRGTGQFDVVCSGCLPAGHVPTHAQRRPPS